ncbi:protein FAM227B-like isoform X1 [Clytia hemisphaerica]|uniref:Protein FAM227B n=1 Tax=Clytia hemisphaerica TaxID=252671 RepID=A0A7M5UHF0_9CNID
MEEMETKKHPPTTFNEWFELNNFEEWPHHVEEEDDETELHQTPAYLGMSTMEEIVQQIKTRAPFQINILDELLEQTCQVEEKILEFSSLFFNEKLIPRKQRNGISQLEVAKYKGSILIEQDNEDRKNRMKELFIDKVRNIETVAYPGFYYHENTPLPGALEAPHLMNHVTSLQEFSNGFRKMWRKYFLSESSVAIMQDAFWWIFLQFKGEEGHEEIQSQIFHRLSNNFVSLFLDVAMNDKDHFFKYFADCLSQALYAAFSKAFPASINKFNHQFRRRIVSLVYEWVTGTQPHVDEILQQWDLESLDNRSQNKEVLDDHALKTSFSFDENSLILPNESSPPSTNKNHHAEDDVMFGTKKPNKKIKESHPSGEGPQFEKIAFDIHGRSPFIMHYLASKELQAEEESLRKIVTRTQMVPKEDLSRQNETYRSIIDKQKKASNVRSTSYQLEKMSINKECQTLAKQRKKDLRRLKRLQDELMTKHMDIKILSEKIMDMMDKANFKVEKLKSSKENEESVKDQE